MLVGGDGPQEGRVEICLNGVRGTVCDDSWGTQDAQVVCRQLGFLGTGEEQSSVLSDTVSQFFAQTGALAFSNAQYGQGTGAIVADDVQCIGSEDNLQSCTFTTNHNCGHSEDAGVSCQGEIMTTYCCNVLVCDCAQRPAVHLVR